MMFVRPFSRKLGWNVNFFSDGVLESKAIKKSTRYREPKQSNGCLTTIDRQGVAVAGRWKKSTVHSSARIASKKLYSFF